MQTDTNADKIETQKTGLFDSHAHYYDERFTEECEGGADSVIRAAFDSGVSNILNVGTNPRTSQLCIDQAKKYKGMYAACGIHPYDATFYCGPLDTEMAELEKLFLNKKENKVVALGEIGLDYYYDGSDHKVQMDFFRAQMTLASEKNLPVIIHDRDAHGDIFDIIKEYKNVRGVLHSYSGSAEMAKELIKLGWYISFSGVVTFKNASRVKEVAKSIPVERLLIETDAPYLAPHPHRGKINHSSLLIHTVKEIAELKNIEVWDLIEKTTANTIDIFEII